ncbi:cbb3-type cytochrome oxidase subunit 3 [Ancylomarina subtilis]|uniref:Cbb3-type cytochrome oxidase subunit 3 n=1 Tax=Ancylomarina subtilis TaxID=1639035 RepID=A0A4V2FT78_9BACT|nr:cbb3-type cytochrome c oxidase subunit 3 [Ancylomarina subtilis]RZT97115.1 cbb3-type cytochrome oxidase subunit 3 [Ancylomarina subtilis]
MKLVSHYLQSISDVGLYPSISLIIFFTFFIGMIWWTFKKSNKNFFNDMKSYALDDDGINSSDQSGTNI